MANFWNSFQYDDISVITSLREQGITLPGIRFGVVAAFALAGMVLALPRFPAARWVLAAVVLHILSLLSVFITERYRLAAVPGLLLFAAFAVWQLWKTLAAAHYSRAVVCGALIFSASFLVSLRRTHAELWALDAYNSGRQALELGNIELAERKLRLAYAYVPDNAELNFALGNLHHALSDQAGGNSFYRRTLELDPQHKGTLNNVGLIALEEQRWEEAISYFERALAIPPETPKTHFLLARALAGAGDTERALAEVNAALRLKSDQPEFLELRERLQQR